MDYLYLLPVIFFLIAFLYSMVGFGGGSSYLATLSFFNLTFPELRAIALLCNILVVSNNLISFRKQKLIDFKKALYYTIPSVPLSFIGASLKISERTFFLLLGSTLLVAAFLTFFKENWKPFKERKISNYFYYIIIGSFLGFLSGMVGIGGGIFLAPILFIFNLESAKKIPAICSLFILLNSIAALLGQSLSFEWHIDIKFVSALLAAVLLGGILGSRFSAKKINETYVRKLTSILIAWVSIGILLSHY